MKRSPIRTVSPKRVKVNQERKKAQEAEWGPRPWTCQFFEFADGTGCFGSVNGHEILKRSQGGSLIEVSGQVRLCDRHNSWVEENPELAHQVGLMRHSWEI